MTDLVGMGIKHVSGRMPGSKYGRVESVDDPNRNGRVQVRIFEIHGGREQTPTEGLPWCPVIEREGCGYDFGPANNFPVGSDVEVGFIDGDPTYPIVKGSFHGSAVSEIEMITTDGKPTSEGTWLAAKGQTIPKDVFNGKDDGDNHPTRQVWSKSWKGHTIYVENKDGEEFLKIVDRAGQVIEMSCPVTTTANQNNGEQRGTREAGNGDQVVQESMVDARGYVKVTDVAGQEILLDGRKGYENITLTSRDKKGVRTNRLILSSEQGNDSITLTDTLGNSLEFSAFGENNVKLTSFAGTSWAVDQAGNLTETAKRSRTQTVGGDDNRTVAGDRNETVYGRLVQKVLSSKLVSTGGSLTEFVGAGFSRIVAGAYQTVVANGTVGDGVSSFAWKVLALAGKISLGTLISGLEISETGTVKLDTPLGVVQVDALGNIQITNTAGGSVVISALGITKINNGVLPVCRQQFDLVTGAPMLTNLTVLV
jgi:hypothetical protein